MEVKDIFDGSKRYIPVCSVCVPRATHWETLSPKKWHIHASSCSTSKLKDFHRYIDRDSTSLLVKMSTAICRFPRTPTTIWNMSRLAGNMLACGFAWLHVQRQWGASTERPSHVSLGYILNVHAIIKRCVFIYLSR